MLLRAMVLLWPQERWGLGPRFLAGLPGPQKGQFRNPGLLKNAKITAVGKNGYGFKFKNQLPLSVRAAAAARARTGFSE